MSDDVNRERARAGQLASSAHGVIEALERFLEFEGPDPVTERPAWMARLDEPLPAAGAGADAVLELLAEVVVPNGLRTGAPGFCGWVTTMPPTVPAIAGFAASIASPQKWWLSPGNFLEKLAIDWLAQLIGLSSSSTGVLVSGGALANYIGLGAARQHAGERLGIDPANDGVYALPSPRVYASENVHHVVLRALGMLGLGRRALVRVPSQRRGGIDTAALARAIDDDRASGATPIAVVASAGDVNTGAIEPIDELRRIAHERALWIHVDGAYGGFAVIDDRVRDRFGDLAAVDSVAIDPHKWLAAPVGCGAAFVRDGALLSRAFALEPAHYIDFKGHPGEPTSTFERIGFGNADHGVEQSSPSRGVAVWAALKEIGADGMRARVARHLDCARRVAERVRAHPDLELLAEPVLSICCFRYHPPEVRDSGTLERMNRAILRAVQSHGRVLPSHTRVHNKLAIRPCFIGPRATLEQADAVVDEVLAAARDL